MESGVQRLAGWDIHGFHTLEGKIGESLRFSFCFFFSLPLVSICFSSIRL